MTDLLKQIKILISDICDILKQLSFDTYTESLAVISNATLGQYFRHIIEFYQTVKSAAKTGIVNYDDRTRNALIETNMEIAKNKLNQIGDFIETNEENSNLTMVANYETNVTVPCRFETTLFRELAYALDHAVHHLALIRIGLKKSKNFKIQKNLGIASSTMRHRKQCAQ